MSHDYHEGLEGYHPDQLLHDNCRECEERAASLESVFAHLDGQQFEVAWRRAAQWQQHGLSNISHAEAGLLQALWGVQIQLERRGIAIGTIPESATSAALKLVGAGRAPLQATVTARPIHHADRPDITVYDVDVAAAPEGGTWPETLASDHDLRTFLQGVRAALAVNGRHLSQLSAPSPGRPATVKELS